MKNSKKLKLVLIFFICISIILIGVLGIYVKKGNSYGNILPEYKFSSDLKGATIFEIEVDTTTEKVYYDKDGNKVESSIVTEENENDYTIEEKPVNSEEILTKENYKEVVRIIEERLKFLKADQYRVDLNEETGKIVLTVEDEYMSDIKSIIPMEGRFELINSNTNDVILDDNDFKSVEASYASLDDGYVAYISIKLNDSGITKINDLDRYKTNEVMEEDTGVEQENEDVNSTETDDTEEQSEENTFKIMFDSEEIAEVSYDDLLVNGKVLRITTASDLTDNSTIQSKLNINAVVAKLTNIGKMPVVYTINTTEFVKDIININCIIWGLIIICAIISLIFIIKYKVKGILAVLSFATNISLLLITIRLTNVTISLNSFAVLLGLILFNTVLVNNILKYANYTEKNFEDNMKKAYFESIDIIVITLIIFVVLSFNAMNIIATSGLLLFWGWLITLLGNLVFNIPMLSMINKK